jgi:hypothetical protein
MLKRHFNDLILALLTVDEQISTFPAPESNLVLNYTYFLFPLSDNFGVESSHTEILCKTAKSKGITQTKHDFEKRNFCRKDNTINEPETDWRLALAGSKLHTPQVVEWVQPAALMKASCRQV